MLLSALNRLMPRSVELQTVHDSNLSQKIPEDLRAHILLLNGSRYSNNFFTPNDKRLT